MPTPKAYIGLAREVSIPSRCANCGIKPGLEIHIDERRIKKGIFWIGKCPDCGGQVLARGHWRVGVPIAEDDTKDIQEFLDREDSDDSDDGG
jgi:predicted RNA-binding Zn-ribbon protein involved in translation (DUF1610 family)